MYGISHSSRALHPRHGKRGRGGLVTALALSAASLILAVPAGAPAAEFPPSHPSLDEYVESLPVPEGRRLPEVPDGSAPPKVALSPETARALGEDPEGQALETLATSPSLGAPEQPAGKPPRRSPSRDGSLRQSDSGQRGFFTALASAVREPGGPPLAPILAMLAVMLLAGGAVAMRRRRRASVRH